MKLEQFCLSRSQRKPFPITVRLATWPANSDPCRTRRDGRAILPSAFAAVGDWDGADAALQEARQLGPELRSGVFLDLDAASIALGRGRPGGSTADLPGLLSHHRSTIRRCYGRRMRASRRPNLPRTKAENAIRSFEAAIRVIEETQSDLNRNEHKLTFLSRLIRLVSGLRRSAGIAQ